MKSSFIFLICISASIVNSQTVIDHIHIDQFGYLPELQKIAILSNPQNGFNSTETYIPGATIELIDNSNGVVVYSAPPVAWNNGNMHVQSGDQVWYFDFSSVTAIGAYYINDPSNNVRSHLFKIDDQAYDEVLKQSVRAFYYQRCGQIKSASHGGQWNDNTKCHLHNQQDLDCRLVTNPSDVSTSRELSGGWHDAGDYNKYVNFAHNPVHNLLFAYEDNKTIWGDDYNIPESGNGIPDLLDEIKVELDWLLKMQNADGSVLMKVSVTEFQGESPPSADNSPRYYGEAAASSTRSFASMMAHASIVYSFIPQLATYSDLLLSKAELAWDWLENNPDYSFYDNAGFLSANPEIETFRQDDYMACAAVYLYAATGMTNYQQYFDDNYTSINPYVWSYWYLFQTSVQDAMLYYANLDNATPSVAQAIQNSFVGSMHAGNPDMLPAFINEVDAYKSQLKDDDYTWGSNSEKSHAVLMYQSLIKYDLNNGGLDDSLNYANAAQGYLHYIHGVNPVNKVMLSNMYDFGGDDCANEIYHIWFFDGTDYDNALTSLYGPPPGILQGGINPTYAPDDQYFGPPITPPMNQPIQKSYKDWNTSFPENSWQISENSIVYQAAYVNMLSKYVGINKPPISTNINSSSIEEINLSIYPNPSEAVILLEVNKDWGTEKITIINNNGQEVYQKLINFYDETTFEINIASFSPGIYYLKCGNKVKEFIKY